MTMAGFLTDYMNNKMLDLIFGSIAFAPPWTLYLGLSQAAANKSGTYVEPSGGGYARVAVINNGTSFPAASGGTKANATLLAFPAPTADWGTIQSLFISDSSSTGNVLAMADLTSPRPIGSGSVSPKVAVGALFLSHT
jgi:hypothetical protein